MRAKDDTETLTKAHLVDAVLDETDMDRPQAKILVEAFFDQIAQSLSAGAELKLTGFGCFATRSKAERPGRNPRTGEPVPVSARRVVTFRASKKLKNEIQDALAPAPTAKIPAKTLTKALPGTPPQKAKKAKST